MPIMDFFSNFYDHINDYPGNYECRMQDYIQFANIPVRLIDIDFHQIDANGTERYKGPEHHGFDVPMSVVRPPRIFIGNAWSTSGNAFGAN
jgi:hypothetical protein